MMHVLDVASREASRSGGAFALELLKYSYVSTCGDSHQLRCQWWAGFPDHDLLVIPGVVCRGLEGLARVLRARAAGATPDAESDPFWRSRPVSRPSVLLWS